MDRKEIERLVLEEGLELTDVIDVVIEINGIIGVGLITLSEQIKDYIRKKCGEANYVKLKTQEKCTEQTQ